MRFDEAGDLIPLGEMRTWNPYNFLRWETWYSKNCAPPNLPARVGNGVTYQNYEYVRHGTLSLHAGIDLVTREAIPLVQKTHKSSDFIVFLKILDENIPMMIFSAVLDNHSAHLSKESKGLPGNSTREISIYFSSQTWIMVEHDRRFLWKDDLPNTSWHSDAIEGKMDKTVLQMLDEVNETPVVPVEIYDG